MSGSLTNLDAQRLVRLAENSPLQIEGGNSSVSMVHWCSMDLAVKRFGERPDVEARMNREWTALKFLSEVDPALAPEPFGMNMKYGVVVRSWVDGSRPETGEQVSLMVESLRRLNRASRHPAARFVAAAAEAIRCPGDLKVQVIERCKVLARESSLQDDALVLMRLVQGTRSPLDNQSSRSTVSPSDFGPHNMLLSRDGFRIIDLEFFGIDDPHKLVADTLLHPLITWSTEDRSEFVTCAMEIYSLNPNRLARVVTLARAKWATIILARASREKAQQAWEKAEVSLLLARTYIEAFQRECQ